MKKEIFEEKFEQLTVSLANLSQTIDIATDMITNAAWGSEGAEREQLLDKCVALMASISELAHNRDSECDELSAIINKNRSDKK